MKKPRQRSKYADRYIDIPESDVPTKILWNRGAGRGGSTGVQHYFSLGKNYKKIFDPKTGVSWYYKLRDDAAAPIHPYTPVAKDTPATSAAAIDAEPVKKPRKRFKTGTKLWFVDTTTAWFLCEVVSWTGVHRLVIRPVTGRDSERRVDWPYGNELALAAHGASPLYARLRPLADKAP